MLDAEQERLLMEAVGVNSKELLKQRAQISDVLKALDQLSIRLGRPHAFVANTDARDSAIG